MTAAAPALAENEGLEDLDEATRLKVAAEGLNELAEVVDRLDAALQKGLDKDNAEFARQMLISTLMQRASAFAGAIFDLPGQGPQRAVRAMQIRQFAINDLQRVIDIDKQMWDAYLLMGRLQALSPGDPDGAARRAFSAIIDAADAPADKRAEALALRSSVDRDPQRQMEDLNRAVALQPEKPDYYRLRAQYHYGKEEFDDALADIDLGLARDAEHAASHELRGMILLGMERYDDSLASFDRASELAPESALPYQHRGELFRQQGDLEKAAEQLSKALEIAPDNLATLLLRASIYFELKQMDKAQADVEQAIRVQPQILQPHLMRAEIYAATDRLDEAIAQLEQLAQRAPDLTPVLSQLGTFYMIGEKPLKAIDQFTRVIELESDNVRALRLRGDAYLNLGEHKEAIADFERALALDDDDDGLLNNFAWVLATSPIDELRDGKRAITLATKACDVAGYETPHILSTLAAAYAETGDFPTAVKWSEKSVEFVQKAIEKATDDKERERFKTELKQLQQELASYHGGKPWRERQTGGEATDTTPVDKQATEPAEQPAHQRTVDF